MFSLRFFTILCLIYSYEKSLRLRDEAIPSLLRGLPRIAEADARNDIVFFPKN